MEEQEEEDNNTTHEPSPSDKSFTFRGGVFIMPYLSLTDSGLRLLILLTISTFQAYKFTIPMGRDDDVEF